MYYLYINSVDRTSYLNRLSTKIDDQIQNKANTCSFKLLSGVTRPSSGQDVKIFDGLPLTAAYGSNTITIANTYSDTGKFRVGTEIYLGIGLSTEEKVTVTAVPTATTLTISTPVSAHISGERMGKLVFGGVISSASDSNIAHNTSVLEYSVSCYDYTKIFDAPNWNSAYENREPRYIINDQLNQNNNANKEIDDMEYANDGAIQTAWTESLDGGNPTIDITTQMQGDSAGVFAWTYSTGSALWETTQSARDFSEYTGVTSGLPTKGNLTLWCDPVNTSKVSSLKIRIGNNVSALAPEVIDSYPESNWVSSGSTVYSSFPAAGQTFTGQNGTLNSCKFYLRRVGNPTGSAVVKIYAIEHTYGSTAHPTGAALATSNGIDVSTIAPTNSLQTFTFSGAERITLNTGYYAAMVEYSGGSGSAYIVVGTDTTSPTHSGNKCTLTTATSGTDCIFYVYIDGTAYLEITPTLGTAGDYTFDSEKLKKGVMVGTVDWTAIDYAAIVVAETATSSIKIDDLRITADGSFTMFNVEEGLMITNYPISFKKPTRIIQDLANLSEKFWYIDYEKDIHFFDMESTTAPFEIDVTNNSDNFDDLSIKPDISLLKNRQVVRGGTEDSSSKYSQVVEGDSAVREWIMKSLFVNLAVTYDDNSTTHAAEAGTTTTNIKITGHGLTTGMHIVNRTRSNAVRKITYVDVDNFTVEAVTSQTNGDTISYFATTKTVGVENLDTEASFDYMYNYNEKSVRNSSQTATLTSGQFLRFEYNERFPIRVSHQDNSSIFAMKALTGGTGVFDGDVITDTSIDSRDLARARAEAEINQYSNPIINGSFTTDQEGLKSGQLITVNDTARGLADQQYLIQKVTATTTSGECGDYIDFKVTFASTLFGIIEFFQKLISENDQIEVDEDETVDLVTAEDVEITLIQVDRYTATETASETPTVTLTPVETTIERDVTSSPYLWQPDASDFRWNLGQWS